MNDKMDMNFKLLPHRLFETLEKSDLIKIKEIFKSIDEPTLVSGVGGSSVVSTFLAKVLSTKNNIICESVTPRDLIYRNLDGYKNVIVTSYSGKNYGVDVAFNNNLKHYLFSRNIREDVININYQMPLEHSFISLGATLIPMTLALLYYTQDIKLIIEILNFNKSFLVTNNPIYEILGGEEVSSAMRFIETTLVESGLGIPIIHDKYDYCHGRTSLSYHFNTNLIHFNSNKELDKIFLEETNKYYENIITLDKKYDDDIINDYYMTLVSMHLCMTIAQNKKKDLSQIEYSPFVKKLYHFKGEM